VGGGDPARRVALGDDRPEGALLGEIALLAVKLIYPCKNKGVVDKKRAHDMR
jgi:hypothetical protein